MLIRLLILRLGPIAALGMCKNRKTMKWSILGVLMCNLILFVGICLKIVNEMQWQGLLILLISLFPQCLLYGTALWMMMRCIWSAWSKRVWRRIYVLSVILGFVGILTENYWNPQILRFFLNNFK